MTTVSNDKHSNAATSSSPWEDMRSVLKQSIGMLGFWMTLRYLLIYALAYKPVVDQSFDRKHGTDTGGLVSTGELGIDDDAAMLQANLFLGAPARVTRYVLRSLDIDYKDFVFVDYGAGKGRSLLVAAEFPFKKVIGVEISQKLHDITRTNLRQYSGKAFKCADIELFCGDARKFALPDTNLVLHMYHPFGQGVLHEVLNHIVASAHAYPRRILIPYLLPVTMAGAVFKKFPQFTKIRDVWCVNTQYRWTLYEYRG